MEVFLKFLFPILALIIFIVKQYNKNLGKNNQHKTVARPSAKPQKPVQPKQDPFQALIEEINKQKKQVQQVTTTGGDDFKAKMDEINRKKQEKKKLHQQLSTHDKPFLEAEDKIHDAHTHASHLQSAVESAHNFHHELDKKPSTKSANKTGFDIREAIIHQIILERKY